MRGKKTDPLFVSQFIQESVQGGAETPDQIIARAKKIVEQIDEEIRAIEGKKIKRSKLLDVISSFEKPTKNKTEDAKLLTFFELEYPDTCKFLCKMIRKCPIDINSKTLQQLGSGDSDPHMKFSIKQLFECKVLARVENTIVCGERFDEYMKFVLREDE
jgi:hypothetical protein